MLMQRVSLTGLVLVALSLGTVTPTPTAAQEQRVDTVAIDEARLTAYAKAYAAIGLVLEQAHADLALPKNKKIEVQKELRDALHGRIEKILRDNGLTQEQYAHVTYVISSEPERRKAFEDILARLTPKPPDR
jgi:hypothetical protein